MASSSARCRPQPPARGYTGSAIAASRLEVLAYFSLTSAAVLRVTASIATTLWAPLVCAAGIGWIIAFALCLWRFSPWLVSAQADGKDG